MVNINTGVTNVSEIQKETVQVAFDAFRLRDFIDSFFTGELFRKGGEMSIQTFHCKEGEYKALRDEVEKRWVIANAVFARDEWHLTAVRKEFLFSMPEHRRERIMQRLNYSESGEWRKYD